MTTVLVLFGQHALEKRRTQAERKWEADRQELQERRDAERRHTDQRNALYVEHLAGGTVQKWRDGIEATQREFLTWRNEPGEPPDGRILPELVSSVQVAYSAISTFATNEMLSDLQALIAWLQHADGDHSNLYGACVHGDAAELEMAEDNLAESLVAAFEAVQSIGRRVRAELGPAPQRQALELPQAPVAGNAHQLKRIALRLLLKEAVRQWEAEHNLSTDP